jgi:hypothetical protein
MKSIVCWSILAAAMVCLGGCGKKGATGELEKAANALAESAPAPAPAPVVTPENPNPQPAGPPPAAPAQEVKQALASYKAGNMEDAVTRLQKLRSQSGITPAQRMALQDSIAAVMSEIYGLAAKGDTRAISAVKQYEAMQTAPH